MSLPRTLLRMFGFERRALLYTADPDVLAIVRRSSWVIGAGAFFDNMGNYYLGPIKALGIQSHVVCLNLVSYVFVMIPLAYGLGVGGGLGFSGVWVGIVVVQFVLCVACSR